MIVDQSLVFAPAEEKKVEFWAEGGWVSLRSAKIHYLWGDLDKRFDLFIVLQQCRRNQKFHFFLRERGGQISLVIWPPKDVRNFDCINDTELQQTPLPPPPRTDVFAFVTKSWRLSSLSTGATPRPKKTTQKVLPQHYPYFLLKRTGIQKQNICTGTSFPKALLAPLP